MREIKDDDELRAIERGIRTAEAIHEVSREVLRPGITELEYFAELFARALPACGEPFILMCDCASGERAAKGGGAPTDRKLARGDLLILDTFPYVAGYRGDITNTLVVGGEPTSEQQELFERVRSGLERAEALLGPGRPVEEVFRAIDDQFRAAGRGERLVHHAGHGLGLGHPESPELVPGSDRFLETGMVVTLEPGIYGKPSGGVRIEHDYLITDRGYRRLSQHRLGLA
jgi:Xaa-Pro aminopeptidase